MTESLLSTYLPCVLLLALAIAAALVGGLLSIYRKAQLYDNQKARLDRVEAEEKALHQKQQQTEKWTEQRENAIKRERERLIEEYKTKKSEMEQLAREKAIGFPWLAQAYAEYFKLQELKDANYLAQKKHPAHSAAEKVRELATRKRQADKLARVYKYQLAYYESLFPWLAEFKDLDIDEEIIRVGEVPGDVHDDDAAKQWLTPQEYSQLPSTEKYQLALDRYWSKKKTNWEVGRDYERFVGYRLETQGYSVTYQGIVEGYDDLGRDLIARKGRTVKVVQCKCWSQQKTIHEKHVFQLYGTYIAFKMDNHDYEVTPHFVTSTKLSERAKLFANHLGVHCEENLMLAPYPSIKCNISRRDNEKIYHLPFDQQYDRTVVELSRGECYAATIADAERAGFRRAWRYRPKQKNGV